MEKCYLFHRDAEKLVKTTKKKRKFNEAQISDFNVSNLDSIWNLLWKNIWKMYILFGNMQIIYIT